MNKKYSRPAGPTELSKVGLECHVFPRRLVPFSLGQQVVGVVTDHGVQQGGGAVQTQRPAAREALRAEHIELVEAPVPVEVHRAALAHLTLQQITTTTSKMNNI